jgi:hypothetical protein
MKTKFIFAAMVCGSIATLNAAPLSESKFTEVVKQVSTVAASTKTAHPATVNEIVKAPDLVRTGPDSRAELTAPDQTLTRIGANTVFSFEPTGREMDLKKGSVLFHSPHGKGGGTIRSGGASAAVLGTTIIVAASPNGGFKFIVLEGKGKATLPNGKSKKLKAGQIIFILPGGKGFSEVFDINLGKLVHGSLLVGGFSHPLPSMALIEAAIELQNKLLENGGATDTGKTVEEFASEHHFFYGLNSIDNNSYGTGIHPPINEIQIEQIFATEGTPSSQFNQLSGDGFIVTGPARPVILGRP